MGSLPELRRLGATTPSPPPIARQTYNAPRHSVGAMTSIQVRKLSGPRPPLNLEGLSSVPGIVVAGRRRESCTSSVGAASVRRLVRARIAGTNGALVTPESATFRAATSSSCTRAIAAAALLPLQVLQGAHGLWPPGPPLLACLHLTSAVAALAGPALLHIFTVRRLIPTSYFILIFFFLAHLYPKIYVLIPAYVAAGACWNPLSFAHYSFLIGLSEGTIRGSNGPNGDALAMPARRALHRRLMRVSRAARDFGLLLAALILPLLPISSLDFAPRPFYVKTHQFTQNNTDCAMEFENGVIAPCKQVLFQENSTTETWQNGRSNITQINSTFEEWQPTESEEELELWRDNWCGARACPGQEETLPGASAGLEGDGIPLAVFMAICCSLAWLSSMALPLTDTSAGPAPWRSSLKALMDSRLRLVGPLSFFIGLEQGFLYAHLMQWYVVCVSGAGQPWRALVGVALLRALVACTLSMLLAHGRRRLVAAVGLMWHGCLLLALSLWRAARADRQLPPVMAAAWASCDAVWELVHSTLIDDPFCGGLTALSLSFKSLGIALSLMMRWLLCARWTLRTLMLALPIAAFPLLFIPDR